MTQVGFLRLLRDCRLMDTRLDWLTALGLLKRSLAEQRATAAAAAAASGGPPASGHAATIARVAAASSDAVMSFDEFCGVLADVADAKCPDGVVAAGTTHGGGSSLRSASAREPAMKTQAACTSGSADSAAAREPPGHRTSSAWLKLMRHWVVPFARKSPTGPTDLDGLFATSALVSHTALPAQRPFPISLPPGATSNG